MQARRFLPLVLLAVMVPFADALFATPQAAKPRRVAFLVGVGKYDHKFSDLGAAPEKDVSDLADTFGKGGFEVVTLTGKSAGRDRATKANIEGRFKELMKGAAGKPALRDGDTVVVVLCGHGIQAEGLDPATQKKEDQPFFCPVDAVPDDATTMVALNGLIRAAEPYGATALFLVDACREITDPNRGTRSGIQGKKVNLPAKTAVLFSCGQGQLAHQSDKAGGGHGLFTYAVLKTLRTDAGPRDDVSWTELVAGVQKSFRSDEFKAMLPAGKAQSPVLATGELDDANLLAARPSGKMAKSDDTGFVPLFNGKDLTGWKVHPQNPGSWKVVDGAIVGSVGTGATSHLFSGRGNYKNFHSRMEVMINDKGNSGLFFRTQFGPGFPIGWEAQVAVNGDPIAKSGSLYPRDPDLKTVKEIVVPTAPHKADEWFTLEVIADGPKIKILIDGKKTVEWTDPKNRHTEGHFAIQQNNPATVVKVRKLEVKELK